MQPLALVYDHSEFIAIDKPPGLPVHQDEHQAGVTQIACQQFTMDKLWLVHRLDKDTSGLLLLAKNQEAAAELSALFAQRDIEKRYLAISNKTPQKKQGSIIGAMQKLRDGNWRLTKSTAKPAISHFFSASLIPNHRLYLLKPYTGKTHQLRVAMKSIGSAILGDRRYGGGDADRLYLHAYALAFHCFGQDFHITQLPGETGLFALPEFGHALHQVMGKNQEWPDKKLKKLLSAKDVGGAVG